MASNPYLLPNFHSISEKKRSLNQSHHCFAFSSQLEYNGSGVYDQTIALKANKTTDFHAFSPALPYFVDRSRLQYNFAANNCLLYCRHQNRDLLLSSVRNKITGLSIEETRSDTSVDPSSRIGVTKTHRYSSAEATTYGPFRYCTQNVSDVYIAPEDDFQPVLDLRLFQSEEYDDSEPLIQTTSRKKIGFYRFTDVESSSDDYDISLDLIQELNVEKVGPNVESMFENCDRNKRIENHLLVSYYNDSIDLYDVETNDTIRRFNSKYIEQKFNKQIGLYWSHLNPFLFFYGEHQKILYCDSRAHKPVIELFKKSLNNPNLFEWENFYQFLPTKLNENQLFLATDCHILVTDCRYPKQNLIQLNHMLPKNIIRSLKSLVIERKDEVMSEILVSTNYYRNCLMSFKKIPDLIPLSSLHLPLHSSIPKDINKEFENCFYRGIQLIDSHNKTGFSLALLTNFGDIFVQDFYWDSTEDQKASDSEKRDRCYSSGVGFSSMQLDPKVIEYKDIINKFLVRVMAEKPIDTNYVKQCLSCSVNRVCKVVDNECQCRDAIELSRMYYPSEDLSDHKMPDKGMGRVDPKHLGLEVMRNKEIVENVDNLIKTTDCYTKKIFKGWDVFEELPEEQVDDIQDMDTTRPDGPGQGSS